MKIYLAIPLCCLLLSLVFSACKKEESPDPPVPVTYPNFSQLSTGNYWVYERFSIDPSGNETALGIYDSCYIEKDTIINDLSYYKFIRSSNFGSFFDYRFVRDSLHYLVNHEGQILFSSQNFTDTFYYGYEIVPNSTDTIYKKVVKMAGKDFTVNTPAGSFQTYKLRNTINFYPNWTTINATRHYDKHFTENIGIVQERLPSHVNNPNILKRRLIRYHVE